MSALGLLVVVLFSSSPSQAQIRSFDKATLEKLGVAIYEQDHRAKRATDILLAGKIDPEKERLCGWIVEGNSMEMLVRFIRETDSGYEALFDVTFKGTEVSGLLVPTKRELTPSQLAQFKARTLALRSIKRPASKTYNPVVLPDPDGDGWLVYALAATTKPAEVMVGGHYRFTVSKDGEKIEQSDELFKSFLVLDKNPSDVPEGSTVEAFFVTAPVSETPLEIHVYLSFLHNVIFYVGTPDNKFWEVMNGTMEIVEPEDEPPSLATPTPTP